MNQPTRKDLDRFWAKVDIRGPDECWEWTACRNKKGYGLFKLSGKMVYAHRLSWALEHGRWLDDDLCVCHSCDNPGCCNPAHLWEGTSADNNHDRDAKGRQVPLPGERNGSAKLTEADVLDIRKRYAASGVTQLGLADEFSVSQQMVSRIVNRKFWKHI